MSFRSIDTPEPNELLRHPPAPGLTEQLLRAPYFDAQDAREAAETGLAVRNAVRNAEESIAARVHAELSARDEAMRLRRDARDRRRYANELHEEAEGHRRALWRYVRHLSAARRRFGLAALVAIPVGEAILTVAAMDALYPDAASGLLGTAREPAVLFSAAAIGAVSLVAVDVAGEALADVQQRRRTTPTDRIE